MAAPFAPWLGVFETVCVREGVPLFFREHAAELKRAMAALKIEAEVDLAAAVRDLPRQSGRARWIVRPGHFESRFDLEDTVESGPIALSVSHLRIGSHNWDALYKTLSYLTHAQALLETDAAECVLLNEHRQVASAARANIFWRKGDRLFTPALTAGCRRGVVREFILGHGQTEEGAFELEELFSAEEVFLTGSMRGIVSVGSLESRAYADFSLAEALRGRYAQEIARQVATG